MPSRRYDVAISYAREDQDFVRRLVRVLDAQGISSFYDVHERFDVWGGSLTTRLTEVYQDEASFCLMMISEHYVAKAYTRLEREAAQARAMYELDYILPVRLDRSDVPGLLPTVACLHVPPETPESVGNAVAMKLGRTPLALLPPAARSEIRKILNDSTMSDMNKSLLLSLTVGAELDKVREGVLVRLTALDERGAARMERRDRLMTEKEAALRQGQDAAAADCQDQLNALRSEPDRDRYEREEIMAELTRITDARSMVLELMRENVARSAEAISKLLSK